MKSVDKFDHPDFVGGIVWSSLELDWIRNRDKEWEHELAECQAENLRMRETLNGIVEANPRKWEELSEPQSEFERWAKSRAKYAIATPPENQSALREVIARVLEDFGLNAEKLRSGEWTPKALK